jgi:hypothetical protein
VIQRLSREEAMLRTQQTGITGPLAPGYAPSQVAGPSAYNPLQTTDPFSGMMTAIMPMFMMIMMIAMLMPMLKNITSAAKD